MKRREKGRETRESVSESWGVSVSVRVTVSVNVCERDRGREIKVRRKSE